MAKSCRAAARPMRAPYRPYFSELSIWLGDGSREQLNVQRGVGRLLGRVGGWFGLSRHAPSCGMVGEVQGRVIERLARSRRFQSKLEPGLGERQVTEWLHHARCIARVARRH